MLRFDPLADMERLTSSLRGGPSGMMPMDMFEVDGMYIVKFDMPGIDPDSVELTVENQMLTVTVERRPEDTEGVNWLVRERPAGRHSRQLRLGASLDSGAIAASYDNGVLTVSIPTREEAKPHRIEIQSGLTAALNS
ncbi:MAG: Hsp20/alpha crystallin family protein [Acidimicrobiia bacterium]|nr:Hsp20/alpha crystallin family protein [Acidimicrobiia bacterium]